MNKSLLYILLSFIVMLSLFIETRAANGSVLDTLPYTGYRLYVTDIKIYQEKSDWIRIQYNAYNTGREKIKIPVGSSLPELQIHFDNSLEEQQLTAYENIIKDKLRSKWLILKVGELITEEYIKFNKDKRIVSATVIREKDVLTPKGGNTVQPVSKKNSSDKVGFKTNTSSQSKAALLSQKELCSDLTISDLRIIKKSKRWLTLQFTINNTGQGPANLFGIEKGDKDNVTIRGYMSGSAQLTRGAINIGGKFLSDNTLKKKAGILEPLDSYTSIIKLDISKQTRYMSVIILSLEAYQTLHECDLTNNTTHILVE